MEHEMRTDAELLNTLLDEADVCVDPATGHVYSVSAKQISRWTSRAVQTISDYRTGKLNIPVDFWKAILRHHYDQRIVALMIPDDYHADITPVGPSLPKTGPGWFKQVIAAEIEHHEKQKHLAEILSDGRVDETDAATVQAYDDAFQLHRQREAILHRAIISKHRQAQTARSTT